MFDLQRFKDAQDARHAGFPDALRELRAGRKASHWIWYVFPQLGGMGHSPMSVRYGLAGADEAAAYLRDPVLVERLLAAIGAAREHLVPGGARAAARIDVLMGSRIDAVKLVSSMTLFGRVARDMRATDPRPELAALVDDAEAILAAAASQGYPTCAFTEARLGPAR
jgi:uncharacterized protein (DUF1810 family)